MFVGFWQPLIRPSKAHFSSLAIDESNDELSKRLWQPWGRN
jgi:hypothetical protein